MYDEFQKISDDKSLSKKDLEAQMDKYKKILKKAEIDYKDKDEDTKDYILDKINKIFVE